MAFNAGFPTEDARRVDDHGTQLSCRCFRDCTHVENMLFLGRCVKPTGCSCGMKQGCIKLPTSTKVGRDVSPKTSALGRGRTPRRGVPTWPLGELDAALGMKGALGISKAEKHDRPQKLKR